MYGRKRAEDWIGVNGLTEKEIVPYMIPTKRDFTPKSIFLGSFIKWNSFDILKRFLHTDLSILKMKVKWVIGILQILIVILFHSIIFQNGISLE